MLFDKKNLHERLSMQNGLQSRIKKAGVAKIV